MKLQEVQVCPHVKTIVVSGARSGTGKTTLAHALWALLPDSVCVKIGHHPPKSSKKELICPMGTPFREISRNYTDKKYLILESNSILNEMTPDCTIFLSADFPKPSAALARKKADIVRGEPIDECSINELSARLAISTDLMYRIVRLSGAIPRPLHGVA